MIQNINGINFEKKIPIKIKKNNDLILLLESNFPEVAQLKLKNKKSGKEDHIQLKQLTKILMPYLIGKKKLASWK